MNLAGRILRKATRWFRDDGEEAVQPHPRWQELQRKLEAAERVVDLGCGANPHPLAAVGVDAFVDPRQRGLGRGAPIDVDALRERGVEFVQAELGDLPFADKSFDFAYSHHVFEHVPDPLAACAEMERVARAGAIITPSWFAEIAFGRPYHRWFVTSRGRTLVFVRKTAEEDRPFGQHPAKKPGGGYAAQEDTNPFDILLNSGGWYGGREGMPRLARPLRRHWDAHSPVMETVHLWEGKLHCVVIDEDGSIRTNETSGSLQRT